MRVGLWRKLSAEELMLLNCGVGEDSSESLGLQGDQVQPVHSEGDQPWDFFGRNDAKAEAPELWPPHVKSWLIGKRVWCWEGLGAGGEGDDRGWDGWMASLTWWTWVWENSGSWWWTGRPGVLLFTGSQRVGHDWATGLKWTELMYFKSGSETFQCKWCRKNTLLEWVRPNPILPLISCRIAGNLLTFHFPNYKMETRPTCIDIRIKFHTHLYVH